jgi:2-polyprenyl-6-methoxyphenol hydroxylase-like FAD-dependent oxidoreductase
MALEDAVVLGRLLDCDPDVMPARLKTYVALRRGRTAAAQQHAHWMSKELFHPAGERAVARDRLLAALTTDDLLDVVAGTTPG